MGADFWDHQARTYYGEFPTNKFFYFVSPLEGYTWAQVAAEVVVSERFQGLVGDMLVNGMIFPVLIKEAPPHSEASFILLDGHYRVLAARLLGIETLRADQLLPHAALR